MTQVDELKSNQSKSNELFFEEQEKYYAESAGSNVLKLENFTKYVSRESIARFLARNEIFKKQLDMAEKLELPIIVHARGMIDQIIKNIREKKIKGGIIHAFNGSFQQAEQLIKLGFKLGFGGVITYERAKHVRSLAQNLPIEAIVLETDAPDMNPSWLENILPNVPAQLKKISQIFCKLRGLDTQVIADTLRRNTIEALPKLGRLYT